MSLNFAKLFLNHFHFFVEYWSRRKNFIL